MTFKTTGSKVVRERTFRGSQIIPSQLQIKLQMYSLQMQKVPLQRRELVDTTLCGEISRGRCAITDEFYFIEHLLLSKYSLGRWDMIVSADMEGINLD